jgi:SAM-dependent methyltransferase
VTISPQDHWHTAVAAAGDAARVLYAAGAQRVWLCGSLAHGSHWDALSDVDYATIGLPGSMRPRLIKELEALLSRHVDVICLEDAPSWIRTQITLEMVAVLPDGSVTRTRDRPPTFPVVRLTGPAYPQRLHAQRHAVATDVLGQRGSRRVLDVGCAEGDFELALVNRCPDADMQVHGIDPDAAAIVAARDRRDNELTDSLRRRVDLGVAGIADLPEVWDDHDAVAAIEVIEHLDAPTLALFAQLVFATLRPRTVVLTSPNADYNPLFPQSPGTTVGNFRHPDHRFEWTREEMRRWLRDHANGYRSALRGIGEPYRDYGSPTQMWVLTLDDQSPKAS